MQATAAAAAAAAMRVAGAALGAVSSCRLGSAALEALAAAAEEADIPIFESEVAKVAERQRWQR